MGTLPVPYDAHLCYRDQGGTLVARKSREAFTAWRPLYRADARAAATYSALLARGICNVTKQNAITLGVLRRADDSRATVSTATTQPPAPSRV